MLLMEMNVWKLSQFYSAVSSSSCKTSFSFHLIPVYEKMISLSWTAKVSWMRCTRKNCVREQHTTMKGFASHGCKANDYLWSNVFGGNMRLCEEDNWKRLVHGLTISGEILFFFVLNCNCYQMFIWIEKRTLRTVHCTCTWRLTN